MLCDIPTRISMPRLTETLIHVWHETFVVQRRSFISDMRHSGAMLHYRVPKTHRMPGGAESGGALFPQPAAHHRGRTMAEFPRIIAIPFPILFPTFFEIERLQTSNFKSDVWDVRFGQIGRLTVRFNWMSDLRSRRRPISGKVEKRGGERMYLIRGVRMFFLQLGPLRHNLNPHILTFSHAHSTD